MRMICVCVFGMATVSRCSSKLFFNAIKMPLYCVQSVFQGFTVITFAQMLVICSLKKTKVAMLRPNKVYILCQMVVFLRQAKWIPWQGHSPAISAEAGYSWQEMVFFW